jgi:DNA repair protein RecN (Recombination protein N)
VLLELRLRNVAVIESVTLPLADGLNVLSGETGAGKSLIVGALGLLLGERAAPDRVRRGADRASVEATFRLSQQAAARAWLEAQGIELDEDVLILKREVATNGRSRAWVNGSSVTVTQLRALGALLVVIHGQHEAQALLDAALQRETLDAFAGALELARAVADAHERVRAARAARAALEERRVEAARRADYLRFVVEEIDAARLRVGEEEELDAEHRRLAHAEELRALAADAAAALHGGHGAVLERLSPVRRALAQLQRIDPTRDTWPVTLDGAYYALEELSRELAQYAETLDVDPARLREVETRRALLTQLLRKHGPTVADVLATSANARTELSLVDDIEAARARADADLAAAEAAHAEVTRALSARRRESAERLSRGVSPLLAELGMAGGRFEVVLSPLDEPGAHGAERVQFCVALNAGLAAGALDRVASGGELSRVMLALSTVLASAQTVTTLIFDEVDAGVGGAVAWQVGALMRRVARHHQVLAISHLAQIAACAHHHIVVRKAATDGWTTADTGVLTGEDRIVELARMLGGDADRAVSRAHARELLERGDALDVGEEMTRAIAPDQPADTVTADLVDGRAAARPIRQRRGKRG